MDLGQEKTEAHRPEAVGSDPGEDTKASTGYSELMHPSCIVQNRDDCTITEINF